MTAITEEAAEKLRSQLKVMGDALTAMQEKPLEPISIKDQEAINAQRLEDIASGKQTFYDPEEKPTKLGANELDRSHPAKVADGVIEKIASGEVTVKTAKEARGRTVSEDEAGEHLEEIASGDLKINRGA